MQLLLYGLQPSVKVGLARLVPMALLIQRRVALQLSFLQPGLSLGSVAPFYIIPPVFPARQFSSNLIALLLSISNRSTQLL